MKTSIIAVLTHGKLSAFYHVSLSSSADRVGLNVVHMIT